MNSDKPELVDTANHFLVVYDVRSDHLFSTIWPGAPLQGSDALNAAAWIVALVDPERQTFDPLLKAILKS